MAGRKEIKVFEYTSRGVYVKTYKNIQLFRVSNYEEDMGKRPIFINKVDTIVYHILPNGNIAFQERVNRDKVAILYRIINSELSNYSQTELSTRPIEMYNLENIKIAEFKNSKIAETILKKIYGDKNKIIRDIRSGRDNTKGLSKDYYFKFKEEC